MSFDYIRGKEKRRINVRGRDMFIAIGFELALGLRRAEMAQDPPHHLVLSAPRPRGRGDLFRNLLRGFALVSIRTPPARAG